MSTFSKLSRRLGSVLAVAALVTAMGGTWMTASSASAAPTALATSPAHPAAAAAGAASAADPGAPGKKSTHKDLSGKLNLNTAAAEQLLLLPSVGPSKADRIIAWRQKNGGFKRIADLRRVKGFGYRTFKRLEPYLDIKGETTLASK